MNYVGISLEKPRLSQAQMDDMADLRIVINVDDYESKYVINVPENIMFKLDVGKAPVRMAESTATWRDRFRYEYAELVERISKLEVMIKRTEAEGKPRLDNTPIDILKAQLHAMQTYKTVLDIRVLYEGHQV